MFGRGETEVEDGGRALPQSPTISTELRVLPSVGMELPQARIKKNTLCIDMQVSSHGLVHTHIDTVILVALTEMERLINLLGTHGNRPRSLSRKVFKKSVSKRSRTWSLIVLCFPLSSSETNKRWTWWPPIPTSPCFSKTSQLQTYHHLTLFTFRKLYGQFYLILRLIHEYQPDAFWVVVFLFHKHCASDPKKGVMEVLVSGTK